MFGHLEATSVRMALYHLSFLIQKKKYSSYRRRRMT